MYNKHELDELFSDMAERVLSVRSRLGLNLAEFVGKTGISKTFVSNVEKSRQNMSMNMLMAVALELGVSPTWLLLGKGNMFLDIEDKDPSMSELARILKDNGIAITMNATKEVAKELPRQSSAVPRERSLKEFADKKMREYVESLNYFMMKNGVYKMNGVDGAQKYFRYTIDANDSIMLVYACLDIANTEGCIKLLKLSSHNYVKRFPDKIIKKCLLFPVTPDKLKLIQRMNYLFLKYHITVFAINPIDGEMSVSEADRNE